MQSCGCSVGSRGRAGRGALPPLPPSEHWLQEDPRLSALRVLRKIAIHSDVYIVASDLEQKSVYTVLSVCDWEKPSLVPDSLKPDWLYIECSIALYSVHIIVCGCYDNEVFVLYFKKTSVMYSWNKFCIC